MEEKKMFLIAEIGINHNGDINITKKLINAASKAGFDAVKFQKRTVDKVYSKEYLNLYRESPWGSKRGFRVGRTKLYRNRFLLQKQKNKIHILIGNLKTTVNKEDFLIQSV
jgi:sialic acid synthase SpsE|tara:strand:- start:3245 stop:3577 length:333 start_codon:yes stop_codon:yes gene_type:complete